MRIKKTCLRSSISESVNLKRKINNKTTTQKVRVVEGTTAGAEAAKVAPTITTAAEVATTTTTTVTAEMVVPGNCEIVIIDLDDDEDLEDRAECDVCFLGKEENDKEDNGNGFADNLGENTPIIDTNVKINNNNNNNNHDDISPSRRETIEKNINGEVGESPISTRSTTTRPMAENVLSPGEQENASLPINKYSENSSFKRLILNHTVKHQKDIKTNSSPGVDNKTVHRDVQNDWLCNDYKTLKTCNLCILYTKELKLSDNVFPGELTKNVPLHKKNIFHVTYKLKNNTNFDLQPSMDHWYESFVFDGQKYANVGNKNLHKFDRKTLHKPCDYFFGLYSQCCRPHLCQEIETDMELTVIRISELHKRSKHIKKLSPNKYTIKKEYHLIIFSYEDDIIFKFPLNNFWTINNTILRLARSTDNNFNFILTTIPTLENVEIYGNYHFQFVLLGRSLNHETYISREMYSVNGCGLLHTSYKKYPNLSTKSKDNEKHKIPSMEIAIEAYNTLINKLKRKNKRV